MANLPGLLDAPGVLQSYQNMLRTSMQLNGLREGSYRTRLATLLREASDALEQSNQPSEQSGVTFAYERLELLRRQLEITPYDGTKDGLFESVDAAMDALEQSRMPPKTLDPSRSDAGVTGIASLIKGPVAVPGLSRALTSAEMLRLSQAAEKMRSGAHSAEWGWTKGLARSALERTCNRLCALGLMKPYVHGGYEVTDAGFAVVAAQASSPERAAPHGASGTATATDS